MSFSATKTTTQAYTLSHAKELASKVTADMHRCQQIYGKPTDDQINNYGTELAVLLSDHYVDNYEFGFLRNGARILSWSYRVQSGATELVSNDRPGKIISGVDLSGARWFNRIAKSKKFWSLSEGDRIRIESGLPIQRSIAEAPPDGPGHWAYDRSYSAGGVSLSRGAFQPYS